MSLVAIWSPYFQSNTRMGGRAYQMDGRVQRTAPTHGELVCAEVRGSKTYHVSISRDGRAAVAECDCPTFAAGAFCKHVWATLLDIQHNPGSAGSPGTPGSSADELATLSVRTPKARKRDASAAPRKSSEPQWMGRLSLLRPPTFESDRGVNRMLPAQQQICYVILPKLSHRHNSLVVDLRQRMAISTGWSQPRALKISPQTLTTLADPIDRELCALILGASGLSDQNRDDSYRSERSHATYRLAAGATRAMLKRMIATKRCFVHNEDAGQSAKETPLGWAGDDAWVLWMVGTDVEDQLVINVQLRQADRVMAIDHPLLVLGGPDGVVINEGKAAPFDDRDAYRWVSQFRDEYHSDAEGGRPIHVAQADVQRFLDRLYMLPQLPEIDLPEGVGRLEHRVAPVPHLELFSPGSTQAMALLSGTTKHPLAARVWFSYDDHRVSPLQLGRFVPVAPESHGQEPSASGELSASGQAAEDDAVADLDEAGVVTLGGGDDVASSDAGGEGEVQIPRHGRLLRRDRRAERDAVATLAQLGLRQVSSQSGDTLLLHTRHVAAAVSTLLGEGWIISADAHLVRTPRPPSLAIASGIDWFELRGSVQYEREDGTQQEITLPEILAAARSGKSMIQLDDGSQGLLPEQWLAEHGLLAAMGKLEGDHLRFTSSQAALLDALLDSRELVSVDAVFAGVRKRLAKFDGVEKLEASKQFHGTLRDYQSDGLGWLAFLRWFGMGGIMADDMGLGKTIQVLAMLQGRYRGMAEHNDHLLDDATDTAEGRTHRPTLIVVPRSVMFNWIDEAQRFTPDLRVQNYTGADRQTLRDTFIDHDVIVTSYGLMRRDIAELREHVFDYVVLDEAQAIKNPGSQSAKAARLLNTQHRLALTGTPIENHLGDLWSIFEFLNPGMLGSNTRFADLLRSTSVRLANGNGNANESADGDAKESDGGNGNQEEGENGNGQRRSDALTQVATALRPFILRRTKQQVLSDLPRKTEQTLLCEMEPAQRQVYDDLRRYYRSTLINQLDAAGVKASDNRMGKAAFMVLEALLRLRQASCHPGLIDEKYADVPSAKLEVLLDRLADIIEEGHKALVFSQFTSMLALVRRQLDKRNIPYTYLDGQTRNRKEVVEKFQTDPDVPVFLISLKTGGLGLNLTAAEYVFILDPWWNPAVEAQAIDRTHRIGQTRPVFAYRMICENTVEQRIAEMQERKRQLADAIIGGEQNVLRGLSREDLERLLS
jgi:superfamily II DNA or RNA helicase